MRSGGPGGSRRARLPETASPRRFGNLGSDSGAQSRSPGRAATRDRSASSISMARPRWRRISPPPSSRTRKAFFTSPSYRKDPGASSLGGRGKGAGRGCQHALQGCQVHAADRAQ